MLVKSSSKQPFPTSAVINGDVRSHGSEQQTSPETNSNQNAHISKFPGIWCDPQNLQNKFDGVQCVWRSSLLLVNGGLLIAKKNDLKLSVRCWEYPLKVAIPWDINLTCLTFAIVKTKHTVKCQMPGQDIGLLPSNVEKPGFVFFSRNDWQILTKQNPTTNNENPSMPNPFCCYTCSFQAASPMPRPYIRRPGEIWRTKQHAQSGHLFLPSSSFS